MPILNPSTLEKSIKPQKELPEERFWDASAKKYLLRQKKQDYSIHFNRIKDVIKNDDTKFILNLACGKIDNLIAFLQPNQSLFVLNIDLSSLIIQFNDNFLLQQGFTPCLVEQTRWWRKNQLFIRNLYGDAQNLLTNTQFLTLSPNTMLLCFDGFPNMNLSCKEYLEDIFHFLQLFSFSYTTWLYPGSNFSFFLEKLQFYYKIVYKKHQIPLHYISCRYFSWDGETQMLLDDPISEFSLHKIHLIKKRIGLLTRNKEISAIQVTFTDNNPPKMRYHAFYGQPSFLIRLAKQKGLKMILPPSVNVLKKNSFIKTYPLNFKGILNEN